ncbi:MAG: TIGR03862 family flavoprotein [Magnetovibrio sp.]|nr:TIGR03862 family flavoprotein [Magnetovibrio sp.]
MTQNIKNNRAVIIGGGPAGLMAAEALTSRGITVDLYDAMPSLGRKFLMAGKSGLNLTHGEPFVDFLDRFGHARQNLKPILEAFTPTDIEAWANDLGVETYVGTSKRVFPKDFKAAPLLRAWLRRLRANGLTVHARHKWNGWADNGVLAFDTPKGDILINAETTILALGGASWPKLGSDANWVPWLVKNGVSILPLKAANCGFDVDWSAHFLDRFEGNPVKNARLSFRGARIPGDFVITARGIEGGPVYALASKLIESLDNTGSATLAVDLLPDRSGADIQARLSRPRGKQSMATFLKKNLNLSGVKAGILYECTAKNAFDDPINLAATIKAVPLAIDKPRPIEEAISTSGGVAWHNLDKGLHLNVLPNVFVAGEMLDWDAPTGGYLLSACLATGRWAGQMAAKHLIPA